MKYEVPPDVAQLVDEQLRSGPYQSADDVLREALHALADRNSDLVAIQAGLEDLNAGRIRPLAEVDAEIRASLGFAPRQ
jgi:Arc/MetJ-type ribon-helix-helix transcriptional regulator